MTEFILRLARFIVKRRKLEEWKDGKRKKWLAEGRNPEGIEMELKRHKVKWTNT